MMLLVLVMAMAMVMALEVPTNQVLVNRCLNRPHLLRNLKVMAMVMFASNVVKVPMVKVLVLVAMLLWVKINHQQLKRKRGLMFSPFLIMVRILRKSIFFEVVEESQ